MAIDFDKSPEDQVAEETGPVLERPLPEEDEEIDDDGGFEEGFFVDDLADEDEPVEEAQD